MNKSHPEYLLSRAFHRLTPDFSETLLLEAKNRSQGGPHPMKRTLSTSEPSSRRKRAPLVAYAAAAIALVLAVECGMLLIGHTHDKEDRLQPAAPGTDSTSMPIPSPIQTITQELTQPLPTPEAIRLSLIGKDKALEIALAHATISSDEAKRQQVELNEEDGQPVYEVEFTAKGLEYDYDIDAYTGDILKASSERDDDTPQAEQKISTPTKEPKTKEKASTPTNQPKTEKKVSTSTEAPNSIGKSKALEIALSHAVVSSDEAKWQQVKQDRENGQLVYEVEFTANGLEYDYDIDVYTGEILKADSEWDDDTPQAEKKASASTKKPKIEKEAPAPTNQSKAEKKASASTEAPNSIGKSRALEIALSHAGVSSDEAKRQRAELDREDGQPVYEVEFVTDGWEYEYVIHAATGVILQYEKDRED
ncbi:MAG: PepSY domain-containing protein [Clostridia bacterium]|nr:PepSY domain-containing protein [Clostridia bacterium]